MSLDRRLRDELHREGDRIVADVERNLGAVEARTRRRATIGAPTLMAAVVVIAVAVALRVVGSPPAGPGASPVASAAIVPTAGPSAAPSFAAIAGTYLVTLDAANSAVAQGHVEGTWTMRLAADGELFLAPPASYGAGASSLSGLAFTIVADRFRSNIFVNDHCDTIGTYTWSLQAGLLSFAPVDDTCAIRRVVLATSPWRANP